MLLDFMCTKLISHTLELYIYLEAVKDVMDCYINTIKKLQMLSPRSVF